MFNKREPRNNEECNKLEKESIQENKYLFMDAKEIAYFENQKHLNNEQKKWKLYYVNLIIFLKDE